MGFGTFLTPVVHFGWYGLAGRGGLAVADVEISVDTAAGWSPCDTEVEEVAQCRTGSCRAVRTGARFSGEGSDFGQGKDLPRAGIGFLVQLEPDAAIIHFEAEESLIHRPRIGRAELSLCGQLGEGQGEQQAQQCHATLDKSS